MSSTRAEERFKTVLQVLAILLLALICAIVLHKAYADVSRLAGERSGADFWRALVRYLFKNMSGG